MLSVEEALEQILSRVRRLPTERVDLLAALGRVLAEPVRSTRVIPPWPNSSMDGYAVRARDTRPGATLAVIGRVVAGTLAERAVGAGEAMRIFTGAPLPDGADAVINLAGESIGDKRWTPQRKARIRDSRVLPTRSLVTAIRSVAHPPKVLINSSAVGYYGDTGAEPRTEDSKAGEGFLAHVAQDWENEAVKAEGAGTRVVLLRTGVVLEKAKLVAPITAPGGGCLSGSDEPCCRSAAAWPIYSSSSSPACGGR